MAIFTVLEPPDGKPERVAFVREGFSWGALLFTFLWAMWHRMWVVAAFLFALSSMLTVAVNLGFLGTGLAGLLQAGVALVFAFEARNLHAKSLEGVGFRRSGLIQANDIEAAELAYFASRAPATPEPAPARIRSAHEDTLGIFGNV